LFKNNKKKYDDVDDDFVELLLLFEEELLLFEEELLLFEEELPLLFDEDEREDERDDELCEDPLFILFVSI